jgi:lipopolysaccharide heptosyltransferase I
MHDARQKFLIIRLSSIGDIVHALPAVSALGRTLPEAEIHWIVETRHARLLEGNPFVQRVVTIDTHAWRKSLASGATFSAIWKEIKTLRREHYDAAIDFQGLYKSALIGWLSGARERLGLAESRLREPAAGFFYSKRISARGVEHVIELNFALLESLGVPRPERAQWEFPLPSSREDEEFVAYALDGQGTKDFIILNPGGGWQSKCWSPEDYAELIRVCSPELGCDFLLTGSSAEEPLIQRIIEQSGSRRARYFPSTVTQFIALARRARLLVAGDTGPLHLATAVRIPVVALFGPTDPARNGPFSPEDITLWNRGTIDYTRRAAKARYLPGISVESVAAAMRRRLGKTHE